MIKETQFLSNNSNINNIKSFNNILNYFFLDDKSYKLIKDIINKTDEIRKSEHYYIDNLLKLEEHRRLFIKIKSNNEDADLSYKKYKEELNSTIHLDLRTFELKYEIDLYDYEIFSNGYFTYKKQKMKLFKTLLKEKILTTDQLNRITTIKSSNKDQYLCISKNPIDFLFCSTNQSFSSCLNLESDYGDSFYMGIPGIIGDPNRVIMFLTKGKFKRYTIKGNEFKHLRYISRTWGILTNNNKFVIEKYYPHEILDFKDKLKNIITFDEDMTTGAFEFDKILYQNKNTCFIYIDNNKINFRNDKLSYNNSSGSSGGINEFNYCNGFENLNEFKDLNNDSTYCENCGDSCNNDNTYIGSDNCPYCEDCFNEYFTYCDNCNETIDRENSYYVESEEKQYCEYCFSKNFTTCYGCDEPHDNDNMTEAEGEWYCEDCLDKYFYECDECDEYINKDEVIEVNERLYCTDCADELFKICNNCNEYKDDTDKINGEDYCIECINELFEMCETCKEYIDKDETIEVNGKFYCNDCLHEEEI